RRAPGGRRRRRAADRPHLRHRPRQGVRLWTPDPCETVVSDEPPATAAPARRTPPGTPPPTLPELVRVQDRLSFVYLERCVVHRDANAITAQDDRGVVHIPSAGIGVLLFGPGTRVTHQ